MRPACILITDSRCENAPCVVSQLAMLRGFVCLQLDLARGEFSDSRISAGTLLAISYPALQSLGAAEAGRLKRHIEQGNTLYIRGGFKAGQTCALSPFAAGQFECVRRALVYRFTDHKMVPAVLRRERADADAPLPGALGLSETAQPLMVGHRGDGPGLPVMFAVAVGSGAVIYDLMPDEVPAGEDTAVVDRLSDPAARCWDVGALMAVK